jgi:nitroreductase
MDIPAEDWNAAIPMRRSRRQYGSSQLDPEMVAQTRKFCREFRPFPQARAELIDESADAVLGGIRGSYGIIKGATAFIAFIGDMGDPHVQEKVGYTGEGIVLEATARGLATCWVAGTFRRKIASSIVELSQNEKIIAVSPIGYAPQSLTLAEKVLPAVVRAHKRKPLSEMTSGLDETARPQWMKAALEAARLAPSAYNRQPWRFHLEPNSITVSAAELKRDFGFSVRLDCGIAMLHVEVTALYHGVHGEWELLEPPQVARFTVSGSNG